MNVQRNGLILVGIAVLSIFLVATFGDTQVLAKGRNPEYRWITASAMTVFGLTCDIGALIGDLCPDMAVSSLDGSTFELTGEGKFSLRGRHSRRGPGKVSGGGSFLMRLATGEVLVGTWTAKKLLSFESFGPSPCTFAMPCYLGLPPPLDPLGLPESWEAGVAKMKIRLVVDGTGKKFDAVLGIFCNLPLAAVPAGHFEGIRVDVKGVGSFDLSPAGDPGGRVTLFKRVN